MPGNTAAETIFLGLLALSICGCSGRISAMKQDPLFSKTPIPRFNLESQTFTPGLEPNDFHLQVPAGEKPVVLKFDEDGSMHISEGQFPEDVFTRYFLYPYPGGHVSIQGREVLRYEGGEPKRYMPPSVEGLDYAPMFPDWARPAGTENIWIAYREGRKPDYEFKEMIAELAPGGKIVREIPLPESSTLQDYQGGLLVTVEQTPPKPRHYQFLDSTFTLRENPLARGLNAMVAAGRMEGSSWIASPQHPWILLIQPKEVPKGRYANAAYTGLFAASFADSGRMAEVLCEGHPLFDSEWSLDVQDMAISTAGDYFVVIAPHVGDSAHVYLGVMREEGGYWRPEAFRLRTLIKVYNPALTFSRDGRSLIFVSLDDADKPVVVHARLEDLLADVNRRYPNAHLTLDGKEPR